MRQTTVVIMNWARPGNVRKLVREIYQPHSSVAEIIVFDAAPPARRVSFDADDTKVVHWVRESGRDLGLVGRFAAAAMARTTSVLLVDDDVVPVPPTIDQLVYIHEKFGGVIATQGRTLSATGKYNITNAYGTVDVALTRACCVSRSACAASIEPLHRMMSELPSAQPYGNGEDIVLSYAARNQGEIVQAAELPYKNINADDEHAISVRFPGHIDHRTLACAWCEKYFRT